MGEWGEDHRMGQNAFYHGPIGDWLLLQDNVVLCFLTVMANKAAGFLRGKVSVKGQMKPLNAQKMCFYYFLKIPG